jgi:hypothetical protein
MKDFNTSLLREKFILHDLQADLDEEKPVIAVSNRMVVDLKTRAGDLEERFIVRAQNMHLCVRMATRLLQSYLQSGKILGRKNEFDWHVAWDPIINEYERKYNKPRWVAVYYKGRVVFEDGPDRHPFLDVIEKCAAAREGIYEEAIPMAEDAFKKTGKSVNIKYDGNVALVVHLEHDHGRCSVIMRGPNKTTTFNFTATPHKNQGLNFGQCLAMAANFLEGIQLAFLVGMNEEKIKMRIIEQRTPEADQTKEAKRRLAFLSAQVSSMESAFQVRYRPERPEFHHIVNEAERLAARILKPPTKEELAARKKKQQEAVQNPDESVGFDDDVGDDGFGV